jgi:hypothetical protein
MPRGAELTFRYRVSGLVDRSLTHLSFLLSQVGTCALAEQSPAGVQAAYTALRDGRE